MPSLRFKISEVTELDIGMSVRHVKFEDGPAEGRCVIVDLEKVEPHIYVFYELVNKSFNPKWGYCPPPEANLGVSVPQLLDRTKPEAKRVISRYDVRRCIFACNTVHTNFVRGNGFVVADGELVYKPPGAVALDGDEYQPLGYHPLENPNNTEYFPYEALVLAPPPPEVRTIDVNRNVLHNQVDIQLAISGPALVRPAPPLEVANVVPEIPVRMKEQGQTVGNEINYDPVCLRTSFTAFGIEGGSNNLIIVSVFAGKPGNTDDDTTFFAAEPDEGITLNEMAELMIELGASHAIAGGGAGDTQQYIYKQGIWAGQPRHQPDRPQVEGLRGQGAILALLRKGGSTQISGVN